MKIPSTNVSDLIAFPVGTDFRIDAIDWESILEGAAKAIAHSVADHIKIYEWTEDGYKLTGDLIFTEH